MTTKNTTTNVQSIQQTLADIADDPAATLAQPSILGASSEATNDANQVIQVNPSERPSVEMTLDELGAIAQKTLRKSAESIWITGRALAIAKKKNPRSFGKWCNRWIPGISPKTRERYMAVGSLDYDDVRGQNVTRIYDQLFGKSSDKKSNPPITRATTCIKSLSKLLESNPEVAEANRDLLVELYGKLTALFANPASDTCSAVCGTCLKIGTNETCTKGQGHEHLNDYRHTCPLAHSGIGNPF